MSARRNDSEPRPTRFFGEYASDIRNPPPHHLCWTHDEDTGELNTTWPSEPDIDVVRHLAISCLPIEFSQATITFFTQGGFNLLYLLSADHIDQEYLMRISLPVDPFYKTESEVATISYLRKYTSIPVPRVIAYDSRARNPLGYEWILMERMPGVPLADVWDAMTFEAKAALTIKTAALLQPLQECKFPMSGNIYFSDIWNVVGYTPLGNQSAEEPDGFGIDDNDEFVIGRMVAPRFFADKRLLLSSNRGPFKSSADLMHAEADLLYKRMQHLSPHPSDRYYCGTDEELAENQAEVLDTCQRLQASISQILAHADSVEDVNILWHGDMSAMNILVDPESHELKGIVDWESVNILPAWDAGDIPYFLQGIEVKEPPPKSPDVDESELVEIRKDWEKVRLRRKYTEILPTLWERTTCIDALRLKRRLAQSLAIFEDRWTAARSWLDNGLRI